MLRIILTLPIALMIAVAPAIAQVQEATALYRAEYLRDACKTSLQTTTNPANAERAALEGICVGALGTVVRVGPQMNDKFRFCPPPQKTLKEIIPVLLDFLDKNPAALKLDIRDVANYVGRLNWPCWAPPG
jgi:hypothetical protein